VAHPNAELLTRFYTAFQKHDGDAMAGCYGPAVRFSDPVFPNLEGERAKDMWRMLCKIGQDLTIDFSNVSGDDGHGSAHWEAHYTFSRTGRPVVNRVEGMFAFRDGLIVRHYDRFSFWRWAAQALGPLGSALGWFAPLQWKVRKDAAASLEKFRARSP